MISSTIPPRTLSSRASLGGAAPVCAAPAGTVSSGAAVSGTAPISGRRAVLVLGMHRSGTSAIARAISLTGFALPRTLMQPTAANKEGFWESDVLMDIHERILKACGSRWSSRAPLRADPLKVARANGLYDELRRAIATEFGDAERIVLKCPRLSRLVPLYDELLAQAGYRVSPVLALRNPTEVARSLAVRDCFSPGKGLGLWLRYTLEAERSTRGRPRAVISYDDLMADSHAVAHRAAIHLGEPWPQFGRDTVEQVRAALRPSLRHHSAAPPSPTSWTGLLARHGLKAMSRLARDPADLVACRTLDLVAMGLAPV